MTILASDIDNGAKNLLINCAEMAPGMRLLIIQEPSKHQYYDHKIGGNVARIARTLGVQVEVLEVPFNPLVTDPDAALSAKMADADRVMFFARLGDQLRFRASPKNSYAVMSYALDADMLASSFGQVDYRAFVELKRIVNQAFSNADEVHVTCPIGTDFRGPGARFGEDDGDTTVKRFPLSVFAPIPSEGYSGRVAQVGFLASTGSQTYEPPACEIEKTLFVEISDSRITGFEGSKRDVDAARAHYDHVASLFDLDRDYVHSWHAGIHPGCAYTKPANFYYDRWSNGAFGNPRILHLHTCGRNPPGEISLNIIDPTVRIDGVAAWDAGRLHPERIAGGKELLGAYEDLADLFANPVRQCGIGPSGRLEY